MHADPRICWIWVKILKLKGFFMTFLKCLAINGELYLVACSIASTGTLTVELVGASRWPSIICMWQASACARQSLTMQGYSPLQVLLDIAEGDLRRA